MSMNGNNCLSFESFLQKRKDTLKLKWVKYWFRLQNTTLFFYTQKHGSALHLRGYYYIYTMQSVREIKNDDSKRFMFEIIMTSGKRKMLAADTASLRKEWVRNLWQAMHLSTSGLGPTHNHEECEEPNTSTDTCSNVETIYASCDHSVPKPASTFPTSEEPIYQNSAFQQSEVTEIQLDGDYDVLPARNAVDFQRAEPSTYLDKGVYDCPISCRRPVDQESPYDVPSALLRKLTDDCIGPKDVLYQNI